MTSRRPLLFLLFWCAVVIGFVVFRASNFLVWDDTGRLFHDMARGISSVSRPAAQLKALVGESFTTLAPSGYRPLAYAVQKIGVAFFIGLWKWRLVWFAFVGAILATMAMSVFLVSRKYLRMDFSALAVTLLFLFSAPVVTASWIVFNGIQAVVPLLICAGLLSYGKAAGPSPHRHLFLGVLLLIYLLGPWYREFMFALPLLIIFLELQKNRRWTAIAGISTFFLLHALFPAILVKLTLFKQLPLKSVFAMGFVGDQLGTAGGTTAPALFPLRWVALINLFHLLPPTLLLTACMLYFIPVHCLGRIFHRENLLQYVLLPVLCVAAALCLWGVRIEVFPVLACLVVALMAVRQNVFLAWWFLLSLLPFLKVYTTQVHLAYALLPALIIVVGWMEAAWLRIGGRRGIVWGLRCLLSAVIAFSVADQSLNLYGSYKVVRAIYGGSMRVGEWFKRHVPPGSIVICNALHAQEIQLFSGNHIQVFLTVDAGLVLPEAGVKDPARLEQLLEKHRDRQPIYCLDVVFPYTPDQYAYHSHPGVRQRGVSMEYIQQIHETCVSYPYLDAWKDRVARPFISFLGPPDLENDFYRGPARNGRPRVREVYAGYHLYRVTDLRAQRSEHTRARQ